ncbi:hypothetical protein FRC0515_00756 [Corynebacterium diphtheriae]|nr:hypothetical protein FRC0515_00756 [Corynebacterium diphtheriae]
MSSNETEKCRNPKPVTSRKKGLSSKECVRSACCGAGTPFVTSWSFSDSYRVFVLGWDSVVVEGWPACFMVGFVVVFFDKIVDFGELILAEIALPGDL